MSATFAFCAEASEFVPNRPFHLLKAHAVTYMHLQTTPTVQPIKSQLRAEAPEFIPMQTLLPSKSTEPANSVKSKLRGDAPAFVPLQKLLNSKNTGPTKPSKSQLRGDALEFIPAQARLHTETGAPVKTIANHSKLRAEAPEFVPSQALLRSISAQSTKSSLRPEAPIFIPTQTPLRNNSFGPLKTLPTIKPESFKLRPTAPEFVPRWLAQTAAKQPKFVLETPVDRAACTPDAAVVDIPVVAGNRVLPNKFASQQPCTYVGFYISEKPASRLSKMVIDLESMATEESTDLTELDGSENSSDVSILHSRLGINTESAAIEFDLISQNKHLMTTTCQPDYELDSRSVDLSHEESQTPQEGFTTTASTPEMSNSNHSGDTNDTLDGCSTPTSDITSDTTLLSDDSGIDEGDCPPEDKCQDHECIQVSLEAESRHDPVYDLADQEVQPQEVVNGKLILAHMDRPVFIRTAPPRDIPLPFFVGFGPSLVEMRLELLRETVPDPNAYIPPAEPEVFHHRSFLGNAVQHATSTSPSLSFAVLHAQQTPWLIHAARAVDLRKHTVTVEAYKLIDPVIVSDESLSTEVRPLSLIRREATGVVSKFYTFEGTWMEDKLHEDDDLPEIDTEYEPDYPKDACIVNGYAEDRGQASVFNVLDASRWYCEQLIMEKSQRVKDLIAVRNAHYLESGVLVPWNRSSPLQQVDSSGNELTSQEREFTQETLNTMTTEVALVKRVEDQPAKSSGLASTTSGLTQVLEDHEDIDGKLATGSSRQTPNFTKENCALKNHLSSPQSGRRMLTTLSQVAGPHGQHPRFSTINTAIPRAQQARHNMEVVTFNSSSKRQVEIQMPKIHRVSAVHNPDGSWEIKVDLSKFELGNELTAWLRKLNSRSALPSLKKPGPKTLIVSLTKSQAKMLAMLVTKVASSTQIVVSHRLQAQTNHGLGISIQDTPSFDQRTAESVVRSSISRVGGGSYIFGCDAALHCVKDDCVSQIVESKALKDDQQSIIVYEAAGLTIGRALISYCLSIRGQPARLMVGTCAGSCGVPTVSWQQPGLPASAYLGFLGRANLCRANKPHLGALFADAILGDDTKRSPLTKNQGIRPEDTDFPDPAVEAVSDNWALVEDVTPKSVIFEDGRGQFKKRVPHRQSGRWLYVTTLLAIFVLMSGLQLGPQGLRVSMRPSMAAYQNESWSIFTALRDTVCRTDSLSMASQEPQVTLAPTKTTGVAPPRPASELTSRQEITVSATPTSTPGVYQQERRPLQATFFWSELRQTFPFFGSVGN